MHWKIGRNNIDDEVVMWKKIEEKSENRHNFELNLMSQIVPNLKKFYI